MSIPFESLGGCAEFDRLVREQSSVLTSAQLVANVGRNMVRVSINRGQWRRLCQGVIILTSGQLTWQQTLWAAVLAAGPGAVLAGRGAAHAAGLRLGDPGSLDVLVPADRRYSRRVVHFSPDMPPVVVRRTRDLPRNEVCLTRPNRTGPARSLVDAASWAVSEAQARLLLFAGCQQRLATPEQVLKVLQRFPRLLRRSLIMETITDIQGGITALSELDFARLCGEYRLPAPERQVRRRDALGRVRYLDAFWRRWRLQVEIDGAHHMDVASWEEDMRRQNTVWLAGERLLRFTAGQVRRRPEEVAAQLRMALEAAGWDGSDSEGQS
jgi:very-short-patch-repair endonuclease